MLPENIGPYRVSGRLGRGGMGEVLRGYDDRLDRPVALKRIRPGGRDAEKLRQRFRREARAAARLSDSGIVQIYDWVEAEGEDWLVMELIDGRTLEEILAEGLPAPQHALGIAREIASGLAAAHEAGLVHRDLKAANIMLIRGEGSAPDRIKILDFGIAKPIEAQDGKLPSTTLTAEGQLVGTINAMSPEQALGHSVDHRSDLFALGVLLYEMLSGASPFAGRSAVETLSRICSWKQTALHRLDAGIPEEVSRFVDHLLAKEPARRPADARQVVVLLDRLLAEAPTEPEPVEADLEQDTVTANKVLAGDETMPEKTAAGRKRPWALAVVTGSLIFAALWGVAWWIDWRAQEPDVELAASAVQQPEAELTSYQYSQRGIAFLERYDRKGNIDKAIADFQKALVLDTEFVPALAGLSSAYRFDFTEGGRDPQRLTQALTVGEQAVLANEHLATAHISLGAAQLLAGRLDEARRRFNRGLEIEPSNGEAWWGLAKVAEGQDKFEEAEQHLLHAVKCQPDNWWLHAQLGNFYSKRARYKDAESAFLHQIELTPDNFEPFQNLGAIYYMQGRLAESATQFQKALHIRPDRWTYSNLGTIQFARGLYAQSVSAFQKAIESGGPNEYILWGNLGDAYRWTPGHASQAEESYRRAGQILSDQLEVQPHDGNLLSSTVVYQAKLGECARAEERILELTSLLDEEDRTAWFRLGVAYEVCGRRDKALAALETALLAGYPINDVHADPELSELRQDVRFHRLNMTSQPSSGR